MLAMNLWQILSHLAYTTWGQLKQMRKFLLTQFIDELITKLSKDSTDLYVRLCSDVKAISVQNLTWKDPLVSQVTFCNFA